MSEADDNVMVGAQAQLNKCALRLAAMSDDLAKAKQIKEYDSDRRKRVLAIAMKVHLDNGESAAAAECKGRSSDYYFNAMTELADELRSALEVIEKADATRVLFESARSLLSIERAKIGIL